MVTITTPAREKRTIAMTNPTTSGASSATILRVNESYSDTSFQSLGLGEALKLSKRPRFMDIPLPSANSGSLPDMFELLHNKDAIGSGTLNYSLADIMIKVADYSALLARNWR